MLQNLMPEPEPHRVAVPAPIYLKKNANAAGTYTSVIQVFSQKVPHTGSNIFFFISHNTVVLAAGSYFL
jgi:hypothetical protein